MTYPKQAFYRPHETVRIPVSGHFQATIWHLGQEAATLNGQDELQWQPPPQAKRGYKVRIETNAGEHWTAFDVLNKWADAPRYGYLFDFSPERKQFELDWMLARHINGIQFYDWMYRHDTLLPPTNRFRDPLERELSLDTVKVLIDAAHERGMVAMAYTAIYAASPPFAGQHPDWGFYDEHGGLYDFAGGFLKIMNLESDWRDHFISQCKMVLESLLFDGIHVDQYGEPQSGFDANGRPIDLAVALAATLQALRTQLTPDKSLLFNLVHNWPVEVIAPTPVDFLYCELWPPQTTMGDLNAVATHNWRQSGGRTPVIAVYINPQHEETARIAQSVILASGGYHLAHGEDGYYLSDPYFPKAQKPASALARYLQRLADFGVAYGELLNFAEPINLDVAVSADLWCIARRNTTTIVLNLINATAPDRWDESLVARPPKKNVRLSLPIDSPVHSVWYDSPDVQSLPQQIAFSLDNNRLSVTVPKIVSWTLVWVQL